MNKILISFLFMIDVHCHLEYIPNQDMVVKEAKEKMLAINSFKIR